jgi:NADH dehydrogenase
VARSGLPILVTGAGGFIGTAVVRRLLRDGWTARAMLRPGSGLSLPPHERLQVAYADMRDGAALVEAVGGCFAIAHLAAATADDNDSDEINVGGARRLVEACRVTGCRRVINISTQSAKILRKGTYARTKSEADAVFRASGLEVTNLLPSIVYGEELKGVFGTLAKLARSTPILPVMGDGTWLSAPVHVDDVAGAVIACVESSLSVGKDYDIGGPAMLTFDELIDRVGTAFAGRRPIKLHVPLSVALALARLVARIPNAPISVSNVLGSNQDTDIDIGPARTDFGFDPRTLEVGLQEIVDAIGRARIDPRESRYAKREESWTRECGLLCRYLVGCEPTPDLIERYRTAVRLKLIEGELENADWRWAQRHPRCIPYLDAAAALTRRPSALRARLYLMAALLESVPAHAERFLPRRRSKFRVFAVLTWQVIRVGYHAAIGVPMLIWARRFA